MLLIKVGIIYNLTQTPELLPSIILSERVLKVFLRNRSQLGYRAGRFNQRLLGTMVQMECMAKGLVGKQLRYQDLVGKTTAAYLPVFLTDAHKGDKGNLRLL